MHAPEHVPTGGTFANHILSAVLNRTPTDCQTLNATALTCGTRIRTEATWYVRAYVLCMYVCMYVCIVYISGACHFYLKDVLIL